MEAVPRLPMLSFELRASVDNVEFSSKLKQVRFTIFFYYKNI